MSVSPLSGAMAQPAAPEKKKKKRGGALLLISGIALTASLGGVFATNVITINSDAGIVFAQGEEETIACDNDGVTVEIAQAWDGVLEAFAVGAITVSGIDASGCAGKDISLVLVDSEGAAVCSVDGSGDYIDAVESDTITFPAPSSCAANTVAKALLASN